MIRFTRRSALILSSILLLSFLCWFGSPIIVKHPGLVGVLVGVLGEIICDWKEMAERRQRWRQLFAGILVLGLAWEFIEASETDREVADLDATNLVLRAKVLTLEAKLNPRVITTDQREKFLNIVTNFPKSPVRVFIKSGSDEADTFANQIRNLLNEASYGTQGETVVRLGNIEITRPLPYPYPTGAAFAPNAVKIVFNGTNMESIVWPGIDFEILRTPTNDIIITHCSMFDVRAIPGLINKALSDIDVPVEYVAATMLTEVKPGEWGLLVTPKAP